MRRISVACALAIVLAAAAPAAQPPFDRKKPPAAGKLPALRVPSWTTSTLSNSVRLLVAEKRGLPLVSISISFLGGVNQFEKADKLGVGRFTAGMLREGTKTRDADALALALQLLGTDPVASIVDESGTLSFVSTTEKFQPTLDLVADMLLNPTFPAPALERLRGQRLIALAEENAEPGIIGRQVFARVLYGTNHPFGQYPTEATIKAVTREDVIAFHREYFQPGRALVTVVGDIDTAAAKSAVERALAGWTARGDKPAFDYPAIPEGRKTAIYLVDKPGAAQSVFNIGLPGPPRSTPDYMALLVMNFILGGHFQSRLNANIREEKGYSYGVRSGFSFGKGPGPFSAGGDVVTAKTDAALVEFMKELRGMLGERPITDDEMKMAKDTLIQRLPSQFSTVAGTGSAIAALYLDDLPLDFYQTYPKMVSAVTREDVVRVAKKYLDLDRVSIVIVGDRKAIEGPLKATGIAPIVVLDQNGNPEKR